MSRIAFPRFWRQLRWRLVVAQLLVVVAGALMLVVAAGALLPQVVAAPLLPGVQTAVVQALLLAAAIATLVGLLTSILLAREILRPLEQIAASSSRIAGGHYDERVPVAASDELGAVAASFNQMAAVLEQIEQQRVALIGNVAHELRTPLAGLEGYLEGLTDGVFPASPETFDIMQHEIRRLRRLVNDLQTLSRVEAGQIHLNLQPVQVGELAAQVVAQVRPQLLDSNLELTLHLPATPLVALADPDRAAQMVLNVVGNAVRYTPAGGSIHIALERHDHQIHLTVTDTGIGIPPEALPYLFERFYRVDLSRSRASGGSGIGLTIARHLAWAMGGDIHAASAGPGTGSTFTIVLPLHRAA